jgi:hypothetical protein
MKTENLERFIDLKFEYDKLMEDKILLEKKMGYTAKEFFKDNQSPKDNQEPIFVPSEFILNKGHYIFLINTTEDFEEVQHKWISIKDLIIIKRD